jgi:hypothetical protein
VAIKNSLCFLAVITALLTYAALSISLAVVLVVVGIGMEMGGTPRRPPISFSLVIMDFTKTGGGEHEG